MKLIFTSSIIAWMRANEPERPTPAEQWSTGGPHLSENMDLFWHSLMNLSMTETFSGMPKSPHDVKWQWYTSRLSLVFRKSFNSHSHNRSEYEIETYAQIFKFDSSDGESIERLFSYVVKKECRRSQGRKPVLFVRVRVIQGAFLLSK